jgi:hypothetical protein
MLSVVMLSVIMLSVTFSHCYAQCHYAECRYAECHYAECRYAECRYAECRYAECRSPIYPPYQMKKKILHFKKLLGLESELESMKDANDKKLESLVSRSYKHFLLCCWYCYKIS